jgi:hypothetical protein
MKLDVLLAQQFSKYVVLNEVDLSVSSSLNVSPIGLYLKEAKPVEFKKLEKETVLVKAVCIRPHCYLLKEFICILHTMAYKYEEKCVFLIRIGTSIFAIIYYKEKNIRFIDILKVQEVLKRIEEKRLDLRDSLIFLKDYKK